MSYTKPWTSYEQQLQQLITRRMGVTDEAKALEYLERIGYYRLSGYWYDMREWTPAANGSGQRTVLESFKPDTRFKDVTALYVFDKRLRMLALDALERIEIALRVDISHRLGQKNPFAYLDPSHFHENFAIRINPQTRRTAHQAWLEAQDKLIGRSREKFIEHYHAKYSHPLPIWVACEVWDFGCMSRLFSGLPTGDQDEIAQGYGVPSGRVFSSWLRSLNFLRNVSAHHGRLWNRNVVDQPKLPRRGSLPAFDAFQQRPQLIARPFLLLCICQHLMQAINPSSTWGGRLRDHLKTGFPDLGHVGITLHGMGIDEGWEARAW